MKSTPGNTNKPMKIIPFRNYDDINARIFNIIRYLDGRCHQYVPSAIIRASMCMTWTESPDKAPGKKHFNEALLRAQEDGLVVAERGRDGGYSLTLKGKKLFEAEGAARKYINAGILRRGFRAYLWPEPPATLALGIAA